MHHVFLGHSSVDTQSASRSWPTCIMLPSTWECRSPSELLISPLDGQMRRTGTTGWYGSPAFTQALVPPCSLHGGRTYLHSHQQRPGSLSSTSSPTLVLSRLSISHSNRREVVSPWCWFAFPWSFLRLNTFFMHLLAVCVSFSEECLGTASAHFKKTRWLGIFGCWVVWVLYIFWIQPPYEIYDLQIFSPIL